MRSLFSDNARYDKCMYPETVRRSCTDTTCTLVFVVALSGLGFLTWGTNSDRALERFRAMPDYNGKFCGLSESVLEKPYVYFCHNQGWTNMGRENRLCVPTCQETPDICPSKDDPTPYEAILYADMLCLPERLSLVHTMKMVFLRDPDVSLFLTGVALTRSWRAICVSAVVSVVLSFACLFILGSCWRGFLIAAILTMTCAMTFAGAYLIQVSWQGGPDTVPESGDERVGFYFGAFLLAAATILAVVSVIYGNNVQASLACIRSATECIRDMPSVICEPLFATVWRLGFFVLFVVGWLDLVAWVDADVTPSEGTSPPSVQRHLHYAVYKYVLMVFYVFMVLWILELGTSQTYFAISFAAQQWFFAPYDKVSKKKDCPNFSVCVAHAVAFRYHLGTLIYSAVVSMLFRVPRMVTGTFAHLSESPMQALRPIGGCCSCCRTCFHDTFKFLTSYALMDTSMNANRYLDAAYHAERIMDHDEIRFFTAHGAWWLVTTVALSFISITGAGITYVLCLRPHYLSLTPQGLESTYIPFPGVVALVAGVVSGFVALPFLLLHGHIADNLLYCTVLDKSRFWPNLQIEASSWACLPCASTRNPDQPEHQARDQPPMTAKLLGKAKFDHDACG